MLFNSLHFAVFFPVVTAVYFAVPWRWRWAWLLAASYYFYMVWEPGYVVLLWCSTLTVYATALLMGRAQNQRSRRVYLIVSLCVNLGLLFVFKYFNFFSDTLRPCLSALGVGEILPHSRLLLPIGISFYTFQALAYSIEVYRGHYPPERHLGRFALYVAFFPTVLSGPIERPQRLLPQWMERHGFEYVRVTDGLKLMVWGLFEKVVVADHLSSIVDTVYSDPLRFTGPMVFLASILFAFQLYCDFAGYSDIAIGAAQVLGIRVLDNFRRPYFASSVADFWRRWHISLSTWFRDYLYIPLGGNRVALPRWSLNIFIVFFLCGLWHGANWTFVVWGLLHGAYIVLGRWTAPTRQRFTRNIPEILHTAIRMAATFALVWFAWIFFRAETFGKALTIIGCFFRGWGDAVHAFVRGNPKGGLDLWGWELFLSVALVGTVLGVQAIQARVNIRQWLHHAPWWIRWSLYSGILWLIFLLGALRQTEFYYFQF
ncbi:MAG TPA: MBOAT family O-acyltransferase [Candidatus Hydrogenedentes bacterium]|nr:MBOAT family O-acyltransferase [Candidatus Hydrogenedentota bacterium]